MKYCLTEDAKQVIFNVFENLLIVLVFVMFCVSIMSFITLLLGATDFVSIYGGTIGIFSWTVIISFLVISFKRWFLENLIIC